MKPKPFCIHSLRTRAAGVALILASVAAPGATLTWINPNGGSWNAPENWDVNQVPGAGDIAVITAAGSYTVTLDSSAAADQVIVGAGASGPTLLINNALTCGTLTVNSGGFLSLSAGGQLDASQGLVSGTLNWQDGDLNGSLTIATNGVLNLSGDAEKTLLSGAALTNYGLVRWSGTGGLTAEDEDESSAGPAIYNQPVGVFEIDSESPLQALSWDYNPKPALLFVNAGSLNKLAGPNTTTFNNVVFQNTGTVDVEQGSLVFVADNVSPSFRNFYANDVPALTSAGLIQVAAGARVQFYGGTCTFLPGHLAQGEGCFGVTDGTTVLHGQVAGRFDWTGGNLDGQLTVATNGVLNIGGEVVKTLLSGAALTNYGLVRWSGNGHLAEDDTFNNPGPGAIYNQPGGIFQIESDSVLEATSAGNDPWQHAVFINAGTLRKVTGAGFTFFSSMQFQNTGTVDVEQGTLVFDGGSAGGLTSASLFQVAAGSAVNLVSGTCTLLPGHLAQGDGFFGVATYAQVTLQGQVAGRFDLGGGYLGGQWTVATNGVFNISSDNNNTLLPGTAMTNYGLVRWSGAGQLYGQDEPYGAGPAAIYNQPGGVFEIDNDSMLTPNVWGYDPSQYVLFVNAGTLRKVAGPGFTFFSSVRFQNTGTVDVEQGTVVFDGGSAGGLTSAGLFQVAAGSAVNLVSGTCTLLPGHLAQGDGFFGLANYAQVTLQGQLAGQFDWESGYLGGQWTIATNGVLNITGDGAKTLLPGTVLTNCGLVRWGGAGQLYGQDDPYGAGPAAIYNQLGGVFEIDNDSMLTPNIWGYDPSQYVILVNGGTLRKAAGQGFTFFSSVQFQNTGTVDVEQGTLVFDGGSAGGLTSAGLFQVAAGSAVNLVSGTCTLLPGHLAQGDGFFGVANYAQVTLQGQVAGRFDLAGGYLGGQWTIATNGVFNISSGNNNTLLPGTAMTNCGLVRWSGAGQLYGQDDPYGAGPAAIYNQPGGVFEIDNDSMLTPNVWGYDPSQYVLFVNAGTLRKVAGQSFTFFSSVQFQNTGTVDVEQGTVVFDSGSAGGLTSAGLFQVAGGSAVNLVSGTCTLLPGHLAQGDGVFGVANYAQVTLQGQVAGRFDLAGGYVGGQWTIATNGVFNISSVNGNILLPGTAMTNYGLVRWSGAGQLYGQDDPYGAGPAAIYNQPGGVFEIDNDSMLTPNVWGYDPSQYLIFANAGTLRKVAGQSFTFFSSVQFQNTGTVDVEQGKLVFDGGSAGGLTSAGLFQVAAGAGVNLSSGTCTLLPGHMVQGDGSFGVAEGAQVVLQGQVAGRFDWTSGGSLSGQWTIAPNGIFNITADWASDLLPGTVVTNYGLVRWSGAGTVYVSGLGQPAFYNEPGAVFEIDNDGTLTLNADNPGGTLLFVNAGTVRKLAGPGTTFFSGVQFQNTGTVDVEQGTLRLDAGSAGGLTSAGLFQVAAGAVVQFSSGTCTLLPGHLAQGDGLFGVAEYAPVTLQGEVAGRFDWFSGSISGAWTIATNGVLNLSGDAAKDLIGALTNYGILNWCGSGPVTASGGNGPSGLWNMPEGTINITDDVQLGNPGAMSDIVLYNGGLLRKQAGTGTATFDNVQFVNDGSLEVWSGSLNLGDPAGSGSQWTNGGTVRLAVFGPDNYTRIQSTGTADLNGALEVDFQNGYLPNSGDAFAVLGLSSTNVAFSSLSSQPVLPAGSYLAGLVSSNQFVVQVHQDPVASADAFTLNEDTPADLAVLTNDLNLYTGATIVSYTPPAHGVLSLNPDNTLHYVPALHYFGADSFTYQARNGDGRLTSASVTLQILQVNQAPVLTPVADQTVDELTVLSFPVQASDPEGGQLTFSLSGAPTGAAVDPHTGVFTWTPSEAQGPGVYSMTVAVTDNGTPSQSASQAFTVTVREVNTAPVLSPIADQTTSELQPFSLQLSATDADLPANTLTYSLVSGPAGLAVSSAGLVSWTPSEAQGPSTNRVTVAVKDDGQPSLSSTQSFQVVVLELNSAPVLPIQTNPVIDELTLLVVTNTATDSDLPANTLTYSLLNPPTGATIDTNGIITWTPSEAQGPSTNLLVTVVTDNGQPPLSATNSFVVVVNEVNSAPVLNPIADQTIPELQPFSLQLSATDSDLPANTLTYSLVSGPAGLAVSPSGLLTWTPTEAQGPSTNPVVVQVVDDGIPSLRATQSFTVVVTEVNTAPVLAAIADQTVRPAQTLALSFTASDVDLPANTLSFSLDAAPAGASVTSGGAFSWTPGFDQAGTTSTVVVRVTDNGTPPLSSTQSFYIVVPNSGLKGDYFAGTNFNTLLLSRDDGQVNFDWSAGLPVPTNRFSVRWTGQVIPRYSQTYTFYTVSDDGVALWVNGQPVINNWTVHLATTNTGTIALTAGQPYMLRLEYFSASTGAVSRLLWSSSSQAKEIVPATQLLCSGYSDVIPNAIYRLTPKLATGRSMEVAGGATADGSQVDINNWKATAYQEWQAVGVGSNYFKLVPQHAVSKALEINGGYTTNGTRVQIATTNGTARQCFTFVNMGQGWFKLQPLPAPASVLDLKGGATANGTAVQLYQDTGADSQRWRLDRQ